MNDRFKLIPAVYLLLRRDNDVLLLRRANTEPQKCDDLSWHPIANLPDTMLPLVKQVITHIVDGVVYSEYTEEPA